MGRPRIDYTNKKIGMLTVLSPADDYVNCSGRKYTQWNCQCGCGNYVTVTSDYLHSNKIVQSCGCHKFIDSIVGKKFGNLEIIEEYKTEYKRIRYKCKCDCGNIVEVDRYDLINNKKDNCGCKKNKNRENRIKDLTDKKFGLLTVNCIDDNVYFTNGGNRIYKWICKCDCGNEVSVGRNKLVSGHTKSCGCLAGKRLGITSEEYWEKYSNLLKSDGSLKNIHNVRFGNLIAKEYVGNRKWMCECDCGGTAIVNSSNLLNGHTKSCGCIDSVGEMIISKYLESHHIIYDKEHTFDGCKDKHKLPFDFCLYDDDLNIIALIEYDGIQHFKAIRFNGMTKEDAELSFMKCVEHDRIKDNFCKSNDIKLVRIKYTEQHHIDEILDNLLQAGDYCERCI